MPRVYTPKEEVKKSCSCFHTFAEACAGITKMSSDFAVWLNEKLRELNTDESVFGSYITGILEGDEATEEKREGLEGILAAIIVSDAYIHWYHNQYPHTFANNIFSRISIGRKMELNNWFVI